ncbi:PRC and DUF2382 domain-containing protein [Antarcticibacterium sp. 1MA-6-2]|uniref:DUF2382 domain-containing protein n=1 Tax=Antarcticibacterium sp. 1MA-6-2 TaxID=2908210 RepID=UPI001F2C9F7D|nr:PRC and DUF2382 domain-containing protein [Antarcticibacterium sp. 1MA-6-2]UJH92336.1 PRC and DUF2382 domain-containing protein [Antarcticibacterium sp. 1MA-6-2]
MNNDRNDDRKNIRGTRLKELDHSDYKIAENQPKIDNWKILDTSGKKVGKVKDLLFDEQALKVRYIITNLKKGDFLDEDRDVLIPIGQAQLDRENERVIVPNINRELLTGLPHYRKVDDLTHDDETRVRNSFAGTTAGTYDRDNFYDHEHFDEDRFYDDDRNRSKGKVDVVEENLEVGKREVETGGARISSRIVERPAEERVNLREEHVHVNRNPVDRPADSADLKNYENRTIEEHETSEVPVVNKEARVVEEVSLEKDVENREEVIKDKVRKTEVDVDRLEGDRNRNSGLTGEDCNRDVSARDPRNSDGDVAQRESIRDYDKNKDNKKDRF